jgi:iron complex transport system substrate-binding protein
MRKISKIMIFSLILSFLITACSSTQQAVTEPVVTPVENNQDTIIEENEPVAEDVEDNVGLDFIDASGKQVVLAGYPERIIVAGKATPYVLDTIYLFPDAAKKLAAIEVRGFDTQEFLEMVDPEVDVKNVLERDAGPEQIAPHQPDLVIVKNISLGQLGSALEEISIPVMGMNLETPEFFYEDIRALGKVFNNESRANEIVEYYQTIEQEVSGLMAGVQEDERPAVLVIQYSEDGGDISFKVPPAGYLQTTMIEKAGGNPVWLDTDGGADGWIQVGLEQIAVWNPEMIFVVNYGGDSVESAQKLAQSDTWQGLQAVENEQIYGFPADYASWDLIDPRWILGQQWLATVIQPERAAEIDLQFAVKSFYQEMYQLSESQIEESVFPRLDELQ